MLSFKRSFDAEIDIGDTPLKIRVKRLTKTELDELDEAWSSCYEIPRGAIVPPDPDRGTFAEKMAYLDAHNAHIEAWGARVKADQFTASEKFITKYITLDAGQIEDDGVPVTNGAGLMEIFHGRRDVQKNLVQAIKDQNHLTAIMAKNSKPLRDSGTGLDQSIQRRSGGGPEPIATPVGSSSSVDSADATDKNESDKERRESSGTSGETTDIKVH